MTALEIIYQIQNLKSGGRQSDDNRLSDAQVYAMICYYRALFLRRELDTYASINSKLKQSILLELEVATDEYTVNCLGTSKQSCILRSVLPLPKFLQLRTGDAILYVGNIDNSKEFTKVEASSLRYLLTLPYTGSKDKYYIQNNFLYVVTKNNALRYIKLEAVFEDPKKAIELNDITKDTSVINEFDPYNFDFPIGEHLIPSIISSVFSTDLKVYMGVIPEDLNDSNNKR